MKERGNVADVSYTATQLDKSLQNMLIQFRIPAPKLKKKNINIWSIMLGITLFKSFCDGCSYDFICNGR